MFDIHIFTLYSLNQTILKKVEKKGKSKGHGSHWNKCHPPHCINYMATGYRACWETGTPQMDNGLHTLRFAIVLFLLSTCALSSASSSWSDCQHQERAGNKVLPCKRLWDWGTTVYINLLKGGTSLLLLTNAISSLQTTTFPHTNDKAQKEKRSKRFLAQWVFATLTCRLVSVMCAHLCLGGDSKGSVGCP